MKFLAVFLLGCILAAEASVFTSDARNQWNQFKLNHKKVYSSKDEHEFRFKIFADNLRKIIEHNREFEEGKATYKMGVNKFTDLLSSEFAEKYLGRAKQVNDDTKERTSLPKADLPDSFDWREKGAVTPIKDQKQCGGCWAFSATGSMEGAHFVATGELVSLSEQQLIDCSTSYGNHGCNGGLEYYGFQYVIDNKGEDTEGAYTYTARNGKCHYDDSKVGTTLSSYKHLKKNDEAELQNAVATIGPISIGIDASGFQFYESGILVYDRCSSVYLDHSVLAVGYGTENGQDYWIVKNSWGESWGEKGYVKMARNHNNMCGVAADASYPIA